MDGSTSTRGLILEPNGAFQQEYALALGLSFCIPAVRYILHASVFEPLATWLLWKRGTGSIPAKMRHRIDKFCESAWKLVVYSGLLALGWHALHDQPWLWDARQFWLGWPQHILPGKVKLYYAAEGAFYTASVAMLVVWEERRRDFLPMLAHHIVTVALIGVSHLFSYSRVGSVVMLLHDPSDVFLEAAKLCDYAGADAAATAFFAGLLASWFALRLVLLPFWVIRSCMFDLPEILGDKVPYTPMLTGMLCFLVLLHAYWFSLIANIAWSKITTGSASDTREDEE